MERVEVGVVVVVVFLFASFQEAHNRISQRSEEYLDADLEDVVGNENCDQHAGRKPGRSEKGDGDEEQRIDELAHDRARQR